MRLRTRLFLAFAVAIVVPMVVVGGLTARSVLSRFNLDYEQRLAAIHDGVEAEVATIDQLVGSRLDAAASSEAVQRLLLSHGMDHAGVAVLDADEVDLAAAVGRSVGLPVLKVLQPDGRILSSGHWPASFGYPDAQGITLAREERGRDSEARDARTGGRLVLERVGTGHWVVLEGAVWVRTGESRLALVGGVPVDPELLERMRRRLGAARVELKASQAGMVEPLRILAERSEGTDPEKLRTVILGLPLGPGTEATLTVGLSTEGQESLIADIRRSIVLLSVSGLSAALLVAFLLARGVTRPVEKLVGAVKGVGRGERGGRVELEVTGELGELISAFNAMIGDLKSAEEKLVQSERVAAWQEIARRLAHEIKNSLFPMQLSIQTLRKVHARGSGDFEETFEESTRTILEEVDSLKNLVEEFSRFARLPRPVPEPTSLAEVLSGVVALLVRPRADVQLEEAIDPRLPLISCDKEQVKRVFLNVIGNALEAMPSGGRLSIRASEAERGDDRREGVDIRIQDSGVGISGEDMKKLFIPYFTTKPKGTGLGLAIAQRIVGEHGGAIRIESISGSGTTVTIHLPLHPTPGAVSETKAER